MQSLTNRHRQNSQVTGQKNMINLKTALNMNNLTFLLYYFTITHSLGS